MRAVSRHPITVWIMVMFTVFAVELAIMFVMPYFTEESISLQESLWDAGILTIVIAPVVWWLLIEPIRHLYYSRGRLLQQLFQTQEQERAALSRDLHDEIGQHMTAINVGLRSLEESNDLFEIKNRIALLRESGAAMHQEIRRMARGLRPYVIDQMGLAMAIERACEDFEVMNGISVKFNPGDFPPRRLSSDIETTLYRIFQEAMTNVARHSRASNVNVILDTKKDVISLQISDNGKGSDVSIAQAISRGSLGLLGMRERAVAHGGRFNFETGMSGTIVEVVIPIAEVGDGKKDSSRVAG